MNTDWPQDNATGREQWDRKAAFWDDLHGAEGNRFHRRMVSPAVERLLDLRPGEQILDIACGTGVLARRLAALGGRVTAVDFSAALLEKARAYNREPDDPVTYRQADATDEEALAALGPGRFAGIVCTMALMDMPIIAPLYRAVRRLLRPGGRFVLATSHPAFSSSNPTFVSEMTDDNGALVTRHALKIETYREPFRILGVGARNEPGPHHYYHRPLEQLIGEAFTAGLVLDGLEEPGYTAEEAQSAPPLSWRSVWSLPPVLAARLRPI